MALDTVAALVEAIGACRLLEPAQSEELTDHLQPRFSDPRLLARELMQLGWLSAYQVNQLFLGKGNQLLLGSYVLLERIGEGGMGAVFKARNWKLGRVVALKLIRKEKLSSPDAPRRFVREIRVASQLQHPNIVRALDADEVNGVHFLVMEYVEGSDLGKHLQKHGPLSVRAACEYVRQAALALQHAHERGLTHRDIKPSNLFLSADFSTVKLLDLGLAIFQQDEESESTLTDTGIIMGTPDYVAPEQSLNSRKADIRSDLYSLGCTFYHLLTGVPPFPGGVATEKLLRHHMAPVPSLEQVRAEVPAAVDAIVRKLMAKTPEDRYQTPAQLAADLARVLSPQAPVAGAVVTQPGPARNEVVSLLDISLPDDLPPPTPPPTARRWPLVVLATGALLALVALTLAWFLAKPPTTPKVEKIEKVETPLSALDRLQRHKIHHEEIFPWQPKDLVAVLGEHRCRAWEPLLHVGVSHDGSRVVGQGNAGTWLFDGKTGKMLMVLPDPINNFLFSPNRQFLVGDTPSRDDAAVVWDVGSEEPKRLADLRQDAGRPLAFSSDGKRVAMAVAQSKAVQIWEMGEGVPAPGPRLQQLARGAVFRNSDRELVTCDLENVYFWNLEQRTFRRVPLPRKYDQTWIPRFSSNGTTLFLVSYQETHCMSLADLAREPIVLPVSHGNFPIPTSDGEALIGRNVEGKVWRYPIKGTAGPWLPGVVTGGHFGGGGHFAISADGKTVVSLATNAIRLWEVGKEVIERFPLKGPTASTVLAAFLPEDGKLVSMHFSRIIAKGESFEWDVASQLPVKQLPMRPFTDAAVASPDGSLIAIHYKEGPITLGLFKISTGEQVLTQPQPSGGHFAFSGNGRRLALVDVNPKSLVQVVEARGDKWQVCAEAPRSDSDVYLALSHDGNLLATTAALFDISGEKPVRLRELGGSYGVAFRPDGQLLAVQKSNTLSLLPLDPTKSAMSRNCHPGSMCFRPDGRRLVLCDRGGRIFVINPDTNQILHSWMFPGCVASAAFTKDGRYLALANTNGTIYILRLGEGMPHAE